jgi:anaerobic selenocysteine-containing dehydrogenase
MGNEKIVKAICNMCYLRCGLDVYVEDGKVTKVTPMKEHPYNTLCPRGEEIIDCVYSPERITTPLRKVNGKWTEVSWDEAFQLVSDKLKRIKEEYGARALLIYTGIAFAGLHDVRAVIGRFCDLYGTPNLTRGASYCHWVRVIGRSLTLDYDVVELRSDFPNTNCMLLWGANPDQSGHITAAAIRAAKRRGVKSIVIDPRATWLAKDADIHAQIRPNTDCALALGLLNVIIAEGLYDKPFVDNWTVGFDKLVEHVKEYTPEKVAEITWVPADMIRDIARTYATTKPATMLQGISVDHSTNGIQTCRASAILIAITGNYDIRGGNLPCPKLKETNFTIKEKAISLEESVAPEYPLFNKFVGRATSSTVTEGLLTGKPYPVKVLIVQGANPLLTWPNVDKLKQAFAKLDFIVVIDFFMTETAKIADLFLPATTSLEKKCLFDYRVGTMLPLLARADAAIEPQGQCMDDWKIWAELGKRLGYGEYFPWEDSDEFYQDLIQPSGITIDQLKEKPGGIFYAEFEEKGYLKNGFNTPSGKVEIYSELMAQHGYDPLPTFSEPPEGPLSTPDLAKEYPLILVSGPRVNMFTHSQHRNIPSLRRRLPEPLLEVNTETAKKLGVGDGEMVNLETLRGKIELKAKVTEDIHPQVVSMQHGWTEANADILTDDMARDPISAYPPFRSALCRVTKK